MKTSKSIFALAAIAMALGLFVSSVHAQSTQLPGEKLTGSELSNHPAQPTQSSAAKSVRENAVDPVLHVQVAQLANALEQALSKLSFETLTATDSRSEVKASVRTDAATSIIDDHNVNVKVGFEARPIGGILTVQVSLTPSFRGIGVSTRPVVSRSVAQAVDAMDETVVRQMVADLTKEIYDEFAAHDEVQ
jgi:hypothetical protein